MAEQNNQNIIGKNTTIEGTVRCSGNVHVSGTIDGDLNVKGRSTVLPGGVIDGELSAKEAELGGEVKGSVSIAGRLVLKSGAVVDGDIKAGSLIIEEGARFNGGCQMGDAKTRPESSGGPARENGKDKPKSSKTERTLTSEPPKKVPAGASS